MKGDDRDGVRTVDDETRHRLDELLQVLSHHRRRDILYCLESMEVTDVDALSRTVAAIHEGVSPDRISPDVHEQVALDIQHTHLPKLAGAGIIEFDQRSRAIRFRGLPRPLERLYESCRIAEEGK